MEQQATKKNKWLIPVIGILAAIILLILLVVGLRPTTAEPQATDPATQPTVVQVPDLEVAERSVLLKSGESVQLTVSGPENVTFTSSNKDVATVDAGGYVKAAGKGNALITITAGEQTAYCGVLVDAQGSMIDVSKQKATAVFSDMILYQPTEIIGLAYDSMENSFYFSQAYGNSSYKGVASDIMVTKVEHLTDQDTEEATWAKTGWMRFYESGLGHITAENDGKGAKLWLASGGDYYGSGTTISRVDWKAGTYGQLEYGETYQLADWDDYLCVAVDVENNQVVMYDEVEKAYYIYDREALLNGGTAVYLHKFTCENNKKPVAGIDDSQGRYNATLRGFAVADGYIYQVSGQSSMYISVFDLNGDLQYCHRVMDYDDLEFRVPQAITCVDGKVYMAVATGSTACYFANVWMFE